MNARHQQLGFSLIELLVAAAVFMFVVTGVSGLFTQAVDLQRRATGIQRIEENAQFVLESIAREVRVSKVTSGDAECAAASPETLILDHPVNGVVTYQYDNSSGIGMVLRNGEPITSTDVDFKIFYFCVSGSGDDGMQTRVTIPMQLESTSGRASNKVSVWLQTTIVSRDLSTDMTP